MGSTCDVDLSPAVRRLVAAVRLQVKEIVHEVDLCNLVVLTNRRLNRALHTDMSGTSTGANTRQAGINRHLRGMERSSCGSDEQHETEGRGLGVPLRAVAFFDQDTEGIQDTPFAGEATRTVIEDALPDMGRVSRAMGR